MKKRKGFQLALILTVVALAIYNILPTIFFYSQPLNKKIDQKKAEHIAVSTMKRVNHLKDDALSWLHSFNHLIGVKPTEVTPVKTNPQVIEVHFANKAEADRFKQFLPKAGQLIPFYPSQLTLNEQDSSLLQQAEDASDAHVVHVQRKIPLQFNTKDYQNYFSFAQMHNDKGEPTKEYLTLLEDRLFQLALSMGGPSEEAGYIVASLEAPGTPRSDEFLLLTTQALLNIQRTFTSEPELATRFYQRLLQGPIKNKRLTLNELTQGLTSLKDRLQMHRLSMDPKEQEAQTEVSQDKILALKNKEEQIQKALSLLKNHENALWQAPSPWTTEEIEQIVGKVFTTPHSDHVYSLKFGAQDPLFDGLSIDLEKQTMTLVLKPDILAYKHKVENDSKLQKQRDQLDQFIYAQVAKIVRWSDEKFRPQGNNFTTKLTTLPNGSSFLAMDLSKIAQAQYNHSKHTLSEMWLPSSTDLKREAYPIVDWKEYQQKPAHQKNFQLVLYAPSLDSTTPAQGFKTNSIYVIAKDLGKIAKKFRDDPSSSEAQAAKEDFESLAKLLRVNGFIGYPGTTYPLSSTYADDYIFEASDFYLPLLQATRENFSVHGTKKWAVLELSDYKERLLTLNKIETQQHQDLLRWKEEYLAAQADPSGARHFEVPKPTHNVFINNLALSTRKYFRGDERKIIHWGLDLKGGKNVQLALKDSNGKTVTNEADIKQGINELYNRVNRMGVSDVTIRQEGSNISLDFPGAENLSASELVKASSMTFHIVNEKFAPSGEEFGTEINQFLTEVWNEAVVTGKKEVEEINQIAWSHLYGDSLESDAISPRSEAAKILFENGLRLMDPNQPDISNTFNDQISKIAMYRGEHYSDWHGQTHPLLITFCNVALEGSNLENVRASYDPTRGNFIVFDIKGSQTLTDGTRIHPRDTLYSWTSVFAKDRIAGTPYEMYSRGNGWRMAVVLNGYVVSAPVLEEPIRNSGSISGQFTQREINRLVADLKAGSLTFTPQILSETSVSPDLGMKERVQSIAATVIALLGVIIMMIGYYRFGGVIASVAVLFNLVIIWAALQNIGATVTIAMLAGVILTLGMAVDANVLVFERIREEFKKTGKLQIAINAGYQKAYSAIVDSNVTTIIAALILLNFDSGPIKGFAISLIIGIVSSMFTALLMTRYFFSEWVQRTQATKLSMANWIRSNNWNFLRYGKLAIGLCCLVITAGIALLWMNRATILGMDFTGGYAVTLEVQKDQKENLKEVVQQALEKHGATSQDFSVRQQGEAGALRLFFSTSMNEPGHPFYDMPLEISLTTPHTYAYETNPRLVWLVNALEKEGITLSNQSLEQLDQNFKSISGQMSSTMRNNALYGLLLALGAILIYITLRFEFTYALGATLGLAFDVLLTLGIIGILHVSGVPLQIDLNTIAALMTIIGYSLNDTIIVYDRIREEYRQRSHINRKEIINQAINQTLGRTVMTSLTTFIVLLALVIFGGNSIFGFSMVMAIGVAVGTLSTLFLATTFLLFFQKCSTKKDSGNVALNGT